MVFLVPGCLLTSHILITNMFPHSSFRPTTDFQQLGSAFWFSFRDRLNRTVCDPGKHTFGPVVRPALDPTRLVGPVCSRRRQSAPVELARRPSRARGRRSAFTSSRGYLIFCGPLDVVTDRMVQCRQRERAFTSRLKGAAWTPPSQRRDGGRRSSSACNETFVRPARQKPLFSNDAPTLTQLKARLHQYAPTVKLLFARPHSKRAGRFHRAWRLTGRAIPLSRAAAAQRGVSCVSNCCSAAETRAFVLKKPLEQIASPPTPIRQTNSAREENQLWNYRNRLWILRTIESYKQPSSILQQISCSCLD
jgi:hypothetical protein